MPHTFNDTEGRTWKVRVTLGLVKRWKTDIDLDVLDDVEAIAGLAKNPVQLVDALYLACLAQADELGVDDEAFGECFDGAAIEQAAEALMGALVDFFQYSPSQHRAMTKALDRMRALELKTASWLEQKLDAPEIEAALDRELEEAGNSFIDSLGSLGKPTSQR